MFKALSKEEVPFKCKVIIKKSTAKPLCCIDKGGYIVQPVPAPTSVKEDKTRKKIEIGNNQNDKLFNLGKAISGVPIKIGTNQFP